MKRYDRLPPALDPVTAGRARADMLDWLAGGPATVAQLGRAVGVTPRQATGLVVELIDQGLAEWQPQAGDGVTIAKCQLPGWAA